MRKLCYTIGWAAIVGSVICVLTFIFIPAIYLFIFGAALVILTAIESWKYQGRRKSSAVDHFMPTGEKYIDEETGKIMRVYYDSATGDRDYRAED